MKAAATLFFGCLLTAGLSADEPEGKVVAARVGQRAPAVSATTIEGKTFSLHKTLKKTRRHAVLIFSRANW